MSYGMRLCEYAYPAGLERPERSRDGASVWSERSGAVAITNARTACGMAHGLAPRCMETSVPPFGSALRRGIRRGCVARGDDGAVAVRAPEVGTRCVCGGAGNSHYAINTRSRSRAILDIPKAR